MSNSSSESRQHGGLSREFFLTKAPKLRGTHRLKREDDSMATGQEEILQSATNYYKDLLAPTLTGGPPSNLMHDVVACLKTMIGEEANLNSVVKIHREGRDCTGARQDT